MHPRDLEDVAQDVFVHVHRRLEDYDETRPIRPWLFAFAARCASDWRKQARHRVELLGVEREARSPAATADCALEHKEDIGLVLRALERVDAERRAVLILHDFDGCSMREIAESLGFPLFTGYSRLRVARGEFATAIRRMRPERGDP